MNDIFYSRQTQCPTHCKPNKKVPNYRMKSCQLSIKKSLRTKDYLYPKAWDRTFSIRCATLSFISGNFSIRILYVFYLYPANKTYDFHVHLTISPVSLVYICFLINLNLLTLRPNYL